MKKKKVYANDNTMSFSIRTDKKLVAEYKYACKNLPIVFKHAQLIHTYMQSIVDAHKEYKVTGEVKLGYTINGRTLVIHNSQGKQNEFDFREERQ